MASISAERLTISRRSFVRRTIAGSGALWAGEALAQPAGCARLQGSSMRWIVPNAPGGGYDVYSRLLVPHLEQALGAEIRVDYVTGASGVRGSRVLRDAAPDGRTVGILNAPALMMASLSDSAVPNPAEDFTILGRVARSQHVWATGASSGIRSMEDVFRTADSRGIVFAINTVNSLGFAGIAVTCSLLGVRADYVAGYPGVRHASLAAIRGEVDLVSSSFDSILDRIQAGDLRPLLQISEQPVVGLPASDEVPCLGGPNGLAHRRASASGRQLSRVQKEATTLVDFMRTGRIVAAPHELAPGLGHCLGQGVCEALGTLTQAGPARQTDTACAETVREEVLAAREPARELLPIVLEERKRARGTGL